MAAPALPPPAPPAMTVASYLTARLAELGVRHVFGVPGDYSLGLCDELIGGGLRWVGTCSELNAGYAADAYARLTGLGVCCVTYGVGGFSALNACAGAFAELVPLVVLSGAPSSADYARDGSRPMPHHALGQDTRAQIKAFTPCTVAAVLLLEPASAAAAIDDALRVCLSASQPILLELPMDVAQARPAGLLERLAAAPACSWDIAAPQNPHATAAAVALVGALLAAAERPALLCGVEVHRRAAQRSVLRLARLLRLPVATTRHGKTALEEGDSAAVCCGVYAGAMSAPPVRGYVEGADLVLILGAAWTDMDFLTAELGSQTMAVVSVVEGRVDVHVPAAWPRRAAAEAAIAAAAADARAHELSRGSARAASAALARVAVSTAFHPVATRAFVDALALLVFDTLDEAAQASARSSDSNHPHHHPRAGGELDGGDASAPAAAAALPLLVRVDGKEGGREWPGAARAAEAALAEGRRLAAREPDGRYGLCAGALGGGAACAVATFIPAFGRWTHAQPGGVTMIADAGDALFAVADMSLRAADKFVAQGFYCSIGYSVPAAVGAAFAAQAAAVVDDGARAHGAGAGAASRRIAVLVGDGAFQMTAQEVGSAVRYALPVTYFVLNNQGYGIERLIHAGPPHNDYNDVAGWDYAALGAALGVGAAGGGGFARRVRTDAELARALADLELPEHAGRCNLIEVWLAQDDSSEALRRLGEAIKVKNKLS